MTGRPGTASERQLSVSLTFDFDAESAWLGAFGVDTPSALSRGAYGANEGVPRILKLLEKYDLPATFFIPGDTCDRHPDVVRSIAAAGHEIGHHGYLHEAPHLLNPDKERRMIERGLDAIQRITGTTPTGYRSPSWELSKATFGLLVEYGFAYDASQLARDRPYWVEDQGTRTDVVEVPSAWELTDSAHFLFAYNPVYLMGMSGPSKVEEIWREDFEGAYEEGADGCYVLTMHPQIIGRHHRMQLLERVIQHIRGYDGVWFAQMRDIAGDFRSRSAVRSA
jgi:peptidoglycan/xylan/chitin deacetylase (PgdA/CDA1 family)